MKGTIQIWDIGVVSMATKKPLAPSLSFAAAHEFGVVRDLKWCPSGCYEGVATERTGEHDPEATLPRLGLLAVASTDGFARILRYTSLRK